MEVNLISSKFGIMLEKIARVLSALVLNPFVVDWEGVSCVPKAKEPSRASPFSRKKNHLKEKELHTSILYSYGIQVRQVCYCTYDNFFIMLRESLLKFALKAEF